MKIIRITLKEKTSKQKVVFFTFAHFESGVFGDAINDRKLFEAIPIDYKKIPIYPKYSTNNRINLKSLKNFIVHYLKEIFASNNIFITRGGKLAILPILLKKIFKNKIIIRLGCTPLMFVERKAFLRNLEFKSKENFLQKIFYFIEPHLEKFALRHADKFIVENIRAKNMILYYGAKSSKIKIIPYYVQEYFLKGKNPNFDKKKDYFKIGYIGRFKKYDLLDPVIKAISLLNKMNFRIILYLIGDGQNRKNIEKLVKEKDLTKNVVFLDSRPHREVSHLIDDYHCLLLPMLIKLCPSTIALKILEGVIKGKIIITTNSGNNASLFLKYRNLILEKASEKSIAQKLKLVIDNYDEYRRIAEELSRYHSTLRSKTINEEKIAQLLIEYIS